MPRTSTGSCGVDGRPARAARRPRGRARARPRGPPRGRPRPARSPGGGRRARRRRARARRRACSGRTLPVGGEVEQAVGLAASASQVGASGDAGEGEDPDLLGERGPLAAARVRVRRSKRRRTRSAVVRVATPLVRMTPARRATEAAQRVERRVDQVRRQAIDERVGAADRGRPPRPAARSGRGSGRRSIAGDIAHRARRPRAASTSTAPSGRSVAVAPCARERIEGEPPDLDARADRGTGGVTRAGPPRRAGTRAGRTSDRDGLSRSAARSHSAKQAPRWGSMTSRSQNASWSALRSSLPPRRRMPSRIASRTALRVDRDRHADPEAARGSPCACAAARRGRSRRSGCSSRRA